MNECDRPTLRDFCHEDGEAPVGLTLAGRGGTDRDILALGLGVERVLAGI